MWTFWKPKRRNIFEFHDGHRKRLVDPYLTLRNMLNHPKYVEDHVKLIGKPGPMGEECLEDTLEAIRDTFEIKPLHQVDGKPAGMTEEETLDVYTAFCKYITALKKNTSPTPTGAQPSDHPAEEFHTSDGSDCGSTETESTISESLPS